MTTEWMADIITGTKHKTNFFARTVAARNYEPRFKFSLDAVIITTIKLFRC
jgi:hypothetical protein